MGSALDWAGAWTGSSVITVAKLSARTSSNLFTSNIPVALWVVTHWRRHCICLIGIIHGMNNLL